MRISGKKISVIVPIYNVETYISSCIESILNQTYINLEVILVNDGSPDGSGVICDFYAATDDRIKVIHKENGGLVSARKTGLQAATGFYIAYVDGDDRVEPEMYASLIDATEISDADIVIAGYKEELNGEIIEEAINYINPGIYTKEELPHEVHSKMLYTGKFSQFGIFSYLWNKLFKKEFLYDFQMSVDNNIFMAEDAAVTYPAILHARSVHIITTTHYHYRQHVNSMVKTRDKNILALEKFRLLYNHLYSYFVVSPLRAVLLEQLNNFTLSLLTVRTDAFLIDDDNLKYTYPFKIEAETADIVICGAGTFGQHLYHRFSKSDRMNIQGWIDEFDGLYQKSDLDVHPFSKIHDLKYDYVLVAFINEVVASAIEEKLIRFGVPHKKILKPSIFGPGEVKQILIDLGIKLREDANA